MYIPTLKTENLSYILNDGAITRICYMICIFNYHLIIEKPR